MPAQHSVSASLLVVSDKAHGLRFYLCFLILMLIQTALLAKEATAAAIIQITTASWSRETGTLLVKGMAKNTTEPVEIFDINGRRLGSSQESLFLLKLSRDELPATPCAIRIRTGDAEATKAITGGPANCKNFPTCKTVQWKAGEFIGCNRCHSYERSFIGGPKGTAKPVATQAPAITSTPVTKGIFGQPYVYRVSAADPDHDTVEYRLNYAPKGMSIESTTGVITWLPGSEALRRTSPPTMVPVSVEVSDGKGGVIHQPYELEVSCPADHTWTRGKNGQATCVENSMGISITSQPPSVSVSTGDRYRYQVISDATKLPLTYSLIGQPYGMSISPKGLIRWQTDDQTPLLGTAFQVRVADGKGNHASQLVIVQVCKAPLQWNVDMWMCM